MEQNKFLKDHRILKSKVLPSVRPNLIVEGFLEAERNNKHEQSNIKSLNSECKLIFYKDSLIIALMPQCKGHSKQVIILHWSSAIRA